MRKTFWTRITALVLCTIFVGCNRAPEVVSSPELEESPSSHTTYQVVDNAPSHGDNLLYVQESPPITASNALAGSKQDVEVEAVDSIFNRSKDSGEVRSVWISYLDLNAMMYQQPEVRFQENVSTAFHNIKSLGFNTVVIQVRPFSDALYNSAHFPWSATITGTEGKDPGYDPLAIMVAQARKMDLRVEAWVNPYRVRAVNTEYALSDASPAKKWMEAGDSAVIKYNGIISYNPASKKAQELIVNGVVEIVKNYDVDGIHIDDYFYPTTDAAFDTVSYTSYKNAGGKLALEDWRRNNVDTLLKSMYAAIKQADGTVLFGISPQGNISNNYNGQYLDVKRILTNPGYCDYICPQVYYGFQNETQPFNEVIATWDDMITVPGLKLYTGIAAYKLGTKDTWAGAGADEWLTTTTQLKDMVNSSRKLDNYGGFMMFRYDHLFKPSDQTKTQVEKELNSLKKIL